MWLSDEEYVFRKDIADKKRTATGAFHKVNGSKSKKCNFPSDYLTRKEKMKLNSEPVTYNLNDFYTYNDFKKLPSDIQVEYIQRLTDKYKVGAIAISQILFEKSPGALSEYLKNHRTYDKIHWHSFTGQKAQAYNAEFARMIDKYRLAIVDKLPEEPEVVEEVEEEPVEEVAIKYVTQPEVPIIDTDIYRSNPGDCSMESEGFDLELFKYLANRYKNKKVMVEINVMVKE